MKHAGPQTLERLATVLRRLRALPDLQERCPGVFYRRSKAFMHFHDDPSGFYADVRLTEGDDFKRFKVDTDHQGSVLIALIE